MTDTFIFFYGLAVSIVAICGFGLMIWAAVEDGKTQQRKSQSASQHSD